VYVLPLNRGSTEAVLPFLSNDEKVRVACYGRERDGRRFAVSRTLLRGVLALHTDIDPGRLVFFEESLGRPYLMKVQANGLDFNLARRDDCSVIALGLNRRIGIDIESLRSAILVESMRTMLPAKDRAAIEAVCGLDRSKRLIAAWTSLEARAKAIGTGLDDTAAKNSALECQHFELDCKFIGCVAAEGRDWQLKLIRQEDGCFAFGYAHCITNLRQVEYQTRQKIVDES
jgi:phosphopantetheinyl transferase